MPAQRNLHDYCDSSCEEMVDNQNKISSSNTRTKDIAICPFLKVLSEWLEKTSDSLACPLVKPFVFVREIDSNPSYT